MEIERKFLITQNIDNIITDAEERPIIQGYLTKLPEVRVRRIKNEYCLTIKGEGAMSRTEKEFKVNSATYKDLILRCVDTVYKNRYYVPLENQLIAEVDVFREDLEGLLMVEVEFRNTLDAINFIPPTWFGREVTDNPNYKNKNILEYFKKSPGLLNKTTL